MSFDTIADLERDLALLARRGDFSTIRRKRRGKTKREALNQLKDVFVRPNKKVDIDFTKDKLTIEDFADALPRLFNLEAKVIQIIEIGDVFYTLNVENIDRISRIMRTGEEVTVNMGVTFSDTEVTKALFNTEKIRIRSYHIDRTPSKLKAKEQAKKKRKRRQGAFFMYNHNLGIDLTRYGLYTVEDTPDYKYNCFYNAMKAHNTLKQSELNYISTLCKNRIISYSDIAKIADKLNVCIRITYCFDIFQKKYGKGDRVFNIGCADEHFYIIDNETGVTNYSLKNYDDVKDIKGWFKIYRKKGGETYEKSTKHYMSSQKLFKTLLENKDKFLTRLDLSNSNLLSTQFNDKSKEISTLEFVETNCKKVERKDKNIIKYDNYFCDFETNTEKVQYDVKTKRDIKIHDAFMMCYVNENGKDKGTFHGDKAGFDFLMTLKNDSRLIFHNLGYDFRFIRNYLIIVGDPIMKGSLVKSVQALFYNKLTKKTIKIHLLDSYAMISMPIKDFPECFGIKNTVKEVMPYGLYNDVNVNKNKVLINDAIKHIKPEDVEQFHKNLKRWDLKEGDYFYHINYSEKYCQIDCEILRKGYLTFREWMNEVTELDIYEHISLPSIVHNYLINKGCYKGVYQLSGVVRLFIQKCLVGGRCMTRNNKRFEVNKKVQDFDAVSLYPSAMVRSDGFLKGKPKVLKTTDYTKIKKYDGYFVEVKIKRIPKKRAFPLLSYMTDKGVRQFTNEPPNENVYLDKTSLEDLIKFQKLEKRDFEIIRGYYFNQGFNPQIKEVMSYLFNERKIKKAEENPIQIIYKLMMNSSYGKTIMKPIDDKFTIIKGRKKALDHIIRNHNIIKYYIKLHDSDQYLIRTMKGINDHFSLPQVGIPILSMSKRIMNEVMCLAEDNNINIYYQDTDSMHIDNDSVDKLAELFQTKYKRELIGKDMGQFHCDFDLGQDKGTLPVSIKSIYLAKKTYLDVVDYIKDGEAKQGYHIRMKGVPNESIIANNEDVWNTYEALLSGDEIEFDLLKSRPMFEFNKNFTITTREKFLRKVSFK
jgi:hypothetical protein